MDKPPTGTRWRPTDVIGGRCRVVLGTSEDAQGIEKTA